MKHLHIFIVSSLLVIFIIAVVLVLRETTEFPAPITCTSDEKVCYDGTLVGRIAPSCEFAKCPVDLDDKDYKDDLIKISSLLPRDVITNNMEVNGEALGIWYFEGSFPVNIYDASSTLLGTVVAQAQSDWMTNNFVPFKAILKFATSTTETGKIVFKRDNPSDLPQNNDMFSIPVSFKTSP